ncbi:MAG: signal peptidase I [Lachnospiraceae bacterium]
MKTTGIVCRLLKIAGFVFCIFFIFVIAVNSVMLFNSVKNPGTLPDIAGYVPLRVLTSSMEPEFSKGDMIIIKKSGISDINIGDVVTFFDPSGDETDILSHRVVDIRYDVDGAKCLITKGDANPSEDIPVITSEEVIGKYEFSVKYLGTVSGLISTGKGIIFAAGIPLALTVLLSVFNRKTDKSNEKITHCQQNL